MPANGGSSLAFAGALFDLEVEVFMVKVSFQQKAVPKSHDGGIQRIMCC